MQTFFRERRYVRSFVVQEEVQEQQSDKQQDDDKQGDKQQSNEQQSDKRQSNEQQSNEQQSDYKQTLAYLSSSLAALKRKDSEAIDRIAEEASAEDRTGWFKRTRWTEHLQAYPDWKLLAYAIRLPGDDEPALKEMVLLVEDLVEQAVCGLGTLSIDTLRWLRSAKPNEADVRPLSRMQTKDSQQRAARLWARLLCYCVRLVVAEDEEEQQQQQQQRALMGIAHLFPWHGRQKLAAQRLVALCRADKRPLIHCKGRASTSCGCLRLSSARTSATSRLRVALSTSSQRWA